MNVMLTRKDGAGLIAHVTVRSSTNTAVTGLTSASSGLIISLMCPTDSAGTNFTVAGSTIETITTIGTFAAPTSGKIRFKEIDATNRPGEYEIQIAAANIPTATTKRHMRILVHGAAGTVPSHVDVPLLSADLQGTSGNNFTAMYDGTGYAGGTIKFQANVVQLNAAVASSIAGVFDANVTQWAGITVASPDTAGCPLVTVLDGSIAAATFASDSFTAIADGVWKRDFSAITGESARSVLNALRKLMNKVNVSGSTLNIYKENDTTIAWSQTITTTSGAAPITTLDTN